MSDEANDNVVVRHLRELRGHVDLRFDRIDERFDRDEERFVKVDGQLADLRGLVLDSRAQMPTRADMQSVVRRLDNIETSLRVAERLAELEQQVAEPRRRVG